MKRLLAILLALTLVLSMAACAYAPAKAEENTDAPAADARPEEKSGEEETPAAEPVELIVFAAASMTETLTEIGNKFKQVEEEAQSCELAETSAAIGESLSG